MTTWAAPLGRGVDVEREPSFGAGGGDPYDHALRSRSRVLYLRRAGEGSHRLGDDGEVIPLRRFLEPADDVERNVVGELDGPVLDVGCGPGRMVRAAIMAGHICLGIDVSQAAVEIAVEQGLPVLRRSVFDALPAEGGWGCALLMDGNIGIGGDPAVLLARVRQLIRHDGRGRVIVEAHPDAAADHRFDGVVVTTRGDRASRAFPWAQVGAIHLRRHAARAGLRPRREWIVNGRSFAEYEEA